MTSPSLKKTTEILHGSSTQQMMDGELLWLEWGLGGGGGGSELSRWMLLLPSRGDPRAFPWILCSQGKWKHLPGSEFGPQECHSGSSTDFNGNGREGQERTLSQNAE